MKVFVQRNISEWLPVMIESRVVTRVNRGGYEVPIKRAAPSPMFSGVIMVPDFEIEGEYQRVCQVEGVLDLFQVGPCVIRFNRNTIAAFRAFEAFVGKNASERAQAGIQGRRACAGERWAVRGFRCDRRARTRLAREAWRSGRDIHAHDASRG